MARATFDPSDPPAIVEASLACPLCLHASDWRPAGVGVEATVECRCRACEHVHTVDVSGAQLLRLAAPDDAADGLIIGAGLPAGWPPSLLWEE